MVVPLPDFTIEPAPLIKPEMVVFPVPSSVNVWPEGNVRL
jgi:hypothetical protein